MGVPNSLASSPDAHMLAHGLKTPMIPDPVQEFPKSIKEPLTAAPADDPGEPGVQFGELPGMEIEVQVPIVPEGLQDTTASLMETLKESETPLEVAVEETVGEKAAKRMGIGMGMSGGAMGMAC